MKNVLAKIAVSTLALILITGISFAQDTGTDSKTRKQEENVAKEQNTVMEQNQVNQQYQERFRASLTQEQIGILENKEMTQNQKKK